jgi:hypothetical protein
MSSNPNIAVKFAEEPKVRDLVFMIAACAFLVAVCLLTIANASSWRAPVHSGWLNSFDVTIESDLNRFANRWPLFDLGMAFFTGHNLIKGAPIVFMYWVACFPANDSESERLEKRRKLAAAAPLTLFALALTRVLALTFRFRRSPSDPPQSVSVRCAAETGLCKRG